MTAMTETPRTRKSMPVQDLELVHLARTRNVILGWLLVVVTLLTVVASWGLVLLAQSHLSQLVDAIRVAAIG